MVDQHVIGLWRKKRQKEKLELTGPTDPIFPFSYSHTVHHWFSAPIDPPGFKMPMCCSQTERRDVERIVSNAKLRGTYLPLRNTACGVNGWPLWATKDG